MDERGNWRLTDALHYEHGRGDPYAAAVRATRMPMVITDPRMPDNPIVFCNEAFQKLTGFERDEIVGRNCRFLQGEETDRTTVANVRNAIENGRDVEAALLNYRKDGTTFWNALYLSPVRDDAGEIIFFFASQLDVTDRVSAEQRAIADREAVEREVVARTADLEQALAAKTLLLHELDHRVKNNLATIGSLLRLQSRATEDRAFGGKLEDMLQRIDALGTVHRRLFQTTDVTRFDVSAFLLELATEVVAAAGPGRITLETALVPVEVAPNHASPIGLILNEIIGNSIKHGFADGRSGRLVLSSAIEGQAGVVTVADDGPGVAADAGKGFGRTLIDRLSRQIGIDTHWHSGAEGTRVELRFDLGRVT